MLVKIDKNDYLNMEYVVRMDIIEKDGKFVIAAIMISGHTQILFSFDNLQDAERTQKRLIMQANDKN